LQLANTEVLPVSFNVAENVVFDSLSQTVNTKHALESGRYADSAVCLRYVEYDREVQQVAGRIRPMVPSQLMFPSTKSVAKQKNKAMR